MYATTGLRHLRETLYIGLNLRETLYDKKSEGKIAQRKGVFKRNTNKLAILRIRSFFKDLLRWRRSSETAANFIWDKANFAGIAIATAKNLTQFHVKFGGCSRLAAIATSLVR